MFSKLGYAFSKRFWAETDETLYGKKVIITGGTSGIGKAAAIKLAEKKACLTRGLRPSYGLLLQKRQENQQVNSGWTDGPTKPFYFPKPGNLNRKGRFCGKN